MSKKVFIVGGLGFIGSEISNRLCQQGDEVVIFDNESVGSVSRLSECARKNAHIITGDIRDDMLVQKSLATTEPDVIIHLAALHYIPYCTAHPEETIDVNMKGTSNIIQALKQLPKIPRFIMASSAAVYGSPQIVPQNEHTDLQPVDIYGESKLACEKYIHSQLVDYIILRLFNTFGPNDPHAHLIPAILSQLHEGEIKLGNASSLRDYVHVSDVAEAFIKATKSQNHQKIYNVGTGNSYSVDEVCHLIDKYAQKAPLFVFNTTSKLRPKDPGTLRADYTKIHDELGWQPRVSFEKGIAMMIKESIYS